MDYIVSDTPINVLDAGEAYFARDWPYGGRFTRTGVTLTLAITRERGCLASALDFLLYAVTLGILGATAPKSDRVQLVATAEGPNETRLTIVASQADMQQNLEEWAAQTLGARPA